MSSLFLTADADEPAPPDGAAEGASAETSADRKQPAQGRVKYPYQRYQSIVDRQMFGPLPPGFDPEKLPSEVSKSAGSEKQLTQEQEKLQSSIHFSMINVTPDGSTVVGFTDNSDPKVPVPMYLKVGEERNGWKVLEADPTTATMRIAKGDIEVSLTIGGNSASAAGATSKTSLSAAQAASRSRQPGGMRPGGLLGSNSLRSRRELRRKAQAEREAEFTRKLEDEKAAREAEKAEREAEKAKNDAEREEQRRQLQSIQEELKKAREAKAAEENREEEKPEHENDAAD